MNLMQILRSLEEFLYELVGWLVFYPRTFWRILRNPAGVGKYAQLQLQQEPERQFSEMISPVLMLILSVILAHGIEMAARVSTADTTTTLRALLFGTEQGLLATRCVIFCTFALVSSVVTLRRQRTPIDRDTLREPFSIQSYLVAPFAVMLSVGFVMMRMESPWIELSGVGLMLVACAWYLWARIHTYQRLVGGNVWATTALVALNFTITAAALLGLLALI